MIAFTTPNPTATLEERIERIERVLGLFPENRSLVSAKVEDAIDLICGLFGVCKEEVMGETHTSDIVWARHVCFYAIVQVFRVTRVRAGKIFGGKNHSTITHGIQHVQDIMETNAQAKAQVEYILNILPKPQLVLAFDRTTTTQNERKINGKETGRIAD